jgi:two-component system sensor histidine kinase TctE
VQFNLPQPAREMLRADDSDTVYYQVLGPRGELPQRRARLARCPADDERPQRRAKCICATTSSAAMTCAWPTLGAAGPAGARLVQVAETLEKRSVLATEIIKGVMLPQFVILPLAVLLVWLALVRGIKPLNQLESASARASPTTSARWTTSRAAWRWRRWCRR